jgi:hypothetical protein
MMAPKPQQMQSMNDRLKISMFRRPRLALTASLGKA